jgi:hypothetical protein
VPRPRHAVPWAVLAALVSLLPAHAAHEWRATWGAPYPLIDVEERASLDSDSVQAAVSLARPFAAAGLTFQSASVRGMPPGWEAHAGLLEAPGYREGHLGIGRRIGMAPGHAILLGVRTFVLSVGDETLPAHAALTLLWRAQPARVRVLMIEAGAIDLTLTRGSGRPESVFVARLILAVGAHRLLLERSAHPGRDSETNWACTLPMGCLRLTQAVRTRTGETSTWVRWRTRKMDLGLGERWHPQLGWTPLVAVRWLRGE